MLSNSQLNMPPNAQIIYRDPTDLSIHPAKKLLVDDWGKEDPRHVALVKDIRQRGIDCPLIIDSEGQIIEGRRRHRAARQLQLTSVPCIIRQQDEVYGIILHGFLQRGHYTKSQLAYLSYPLIEPALAEIKARQLKNLQQGVSKVRNTIESTDSSESPRCGLSANSAEELADDVGIGRSLFFMAQDVHQLFRKHTSPRDLTDSDGILESGVTFRAFYEPRILRQEFDAEGKRQSPYGLGAVKAGIEGSLKNNGAAKAPVPAQLELFNEGWELVGKRMRYWQDFKEPDKAKALGAVRDTFALMPSDLLTDFQRVIKEIKKTRKKTAKQQPKEK